MSLVKQLAPRWKLNAVISQANALLSVLLPVKNGSDKTPAVSYCTGDLDSFELWKTDSSATLFPSDSIQNDTEGVDGAGSPPCMVSVLHCRAPVRDSHPCSTSGMHWTGKKSLDPWSRRVSCTRWMWRLPCFTAKQGIFTKPLCLSGCQWTWCSAVGQQVSGETREVWNHLDLGGELGWQSLTHSQPFSPHLRASSFPAWFSDTISPRTSFPHCSFLSSLGPCPRWNHKKEQELSPITAKSLFCKWSLVAKWKVQHIYRALAQSLGAELNISTIQTRTIARPSQRKNQLITRSPDWLPVVCVRFLEHVCKACYTY